MIKSIPTFTNSATLKEYRAAFDSFQCVRFKQAICNFEIPPADYDCDYVGRARDGDDDDDSLCRSRSSTSRSRSSGHGASQIEKKRKHKRKRSNNSNSNSNVKDLPSNEYNAFSGKSKSLAEYYQEVLLRTIQSASSKDQESWAVENNENYIDIDITPEQFLSPPIHMNNMNNAQRRGYCSFVLQDNSNDAVSHFTGQHVLKLKQYQSNQSLSLSLPLPLLFSNAQEEQEIKNTIHVADPYWFFIGRNINIYDDDDSTDTNNYCTSHVNVLKGRTEHTDDIHHNGGTVHYQIVGDKTWKLRPTEELRDMCRSRSRDNSTNMNKNENARSEVSNELKDQYIITVEEGDVFVINTRLWWHQTEIPPFSAKNRRKGASGAHTPSAHISISYARDIYLDGTQLTQEDQDGNANTNSNAHSNESEGDTVCNKEGAWATGFIPKGTVLLTEKDGPPPIMARTRILTEANCKLISVPAGMDEDEDNDDDNEDADSMDESGDGKMALVTIKDIQEGEFFTLLRADEKKEHGDDDEKVEKISNRKT